MLSVAHLFDNLPTDIIYYEIFPYLDYDSRVIANTMLPAVDRHRRKLKSEAVLKFSMKLGACRIKTLLDAHARAKNPIQRSRLLLRLWRTVPQHPALLRHCEQFRCVVKKKATEFFNLPPSEKDCLSYYSMRQLQTLCRRVLEILDVECPFEREVMMDCNDAAFVGGRDV